MYIHARNEAGLCPASKDGIQVRSCLSDREFIAWGLDFDCVVEIYQVIRTLCYLVTGRSYLCMGASGTAIRVAPAQQNRHPTSRSGVRNSAQIAGATRNT